MLYQETPEGFVPWGGEAIDGVIHPRAIEQLWTPVELAAAGLFHPVDLGIPEGFREVSREIVRVGSEVVVSYTTEPIPAADPADYPLSDRQLRIGLLVNGYTLETVDGAIGTIPDPVERAVAKVWWDRTTTIEWNHPMTQTLMALAGIPAESRVALWMQSHAIPA